MMNERIQIINIFVNLNFADTPYCAPPSVWFENTVTILPLFFYSDTKCVSAASAPGAPT
jgi:hypothetical protein